MRVAFIVIRERWKMPDKKYLLFDLDGTLTDPKIGITSCVQYALRSFGIEEPDLDQLTGYIGPPLVDSFQVYHGLSEEDAQKALIKYRERFGTVGILENDVIDGIVQMLEAFWEKGFVMLLATSKPQEYAEKITEHFGLAQYLTIQVGSGMDGSRKFKKDVIEVALDKIVDLIVTGKIVGDTYDNILQQTPINKEELLEVVKAEAIMIGDRHHDIDGAKECGIESIGVRFGYAKENELEEACADYIVATPQELEALLLT